MGELLGAALDIIAVFGLDGILDSTGSRVVDTEDGTLHQLDLTGGITAQATTPARGTPRSLSLAPGFCGGSLTAGIRRGDTTGNTKGRGRVIHSLARVDGARVGVVLSGIMGVTFRQAVAGTGTRDGGDVALVHIVEWTLTGQESMSSLFFRLAILESREPC